MDDAPQTPKVCGTCRHRNDCAILRASPTSIMTASGATVSTESLPPPCGGDLWSPRVVPNGPIKRKAFSQFRPPKPEDRLPQEPPAKPVRRLDDLDH